MTHPKDAGSIEAAIDEVIVALGGSEAAARILDVGRSTVDSWKNPSRKAKPSIDQAVTLDSAFADQTRHGLLTPIMASLVLGVEKRRQSSTVVNLLDEILRARQLIEEIAAGLLTHARDGRLGDRSEFTAKELERLEWSIYEAVRRLVGISLAAKVATGRPHLSRRNSVRYSASPVGIMDKK